MCNLFPYRWTFRTVLRNIFFACFSIYIGIINIFRWAPVIWSDRDFDWIYLSHIMRYKLTRMAKLFEKYGYHVNSGKDARNMRLCSILLKRMMDDKYDCGFNHKDFNGAARDSKYFGKVLSKNLLRWWD